MHFPIIFAAKYLHLIVILAAVIALAIKDSSTRRKIIKLGVLALPASYLTAKILSHFFYNPRPFVVEHTTPLISHAANNGFPSDHTLLAMTVAATFFIYDRRIGTMLAILSLAVGLGRILTRVHYPIDVSASAVIAFLITYSCYLILKKVKFLDVFLDKVLKTFRI